MTTELEEVIVAKLTGTAAIAAYVGDRLYPGRLPDDDPAQVYPAGVYQRIDTVDLDGLVCSAEMPTARIQLDWYAASYGEVKLLARVVRATLRRWDDAGTTPVILETILDNDRDWPADDELGTAARKVYRVWQDWRITYREAGGV